MSLIQLLKLRTRKTNLFKMPHFETPRFQMGTKVAIASGLGQAGKIINKLNFLKKQPKLRYNRPMCNVGISAVAA